MMVSVMEEESRVQEFIIGYCPHVTVGGFPGKVAFGMNPGGQERAF